MFIDRFEVISAKAQTILSHLYSIPTVDFELTSASAIEFLVYYYFGIDVQTRLHWGMLRSLSDARASRGREARESNIFLDWAVQDFSTLSQPASRSNILGYHYN